MVNIEVIEIKLWLNYSWIIYILLKRKLFIIQPNINYLKIVCGLTSSLMAAKILKKEGVGNTWFGEVKFKLKINFNL